MDNDNIFLKKLSDFLVGSRKGSDEKFVISNTDRILIDDLPAIINTWLGYKSNKYKVYSSIGRGNRADIPWLAILDKEVTNTTTKGYYVCLLFSRHFTSVYLCLSLGWTQFQEQFGTAEGKRQMKLIKDHYAKKLKPRDSTIQNGHIPLGAITTLGKGYEDGALVFKKLNFVSMTDATIRNDISNFLRMYDRLKTLVGSSTLNLVIDLHSEESTDGSEEQEFQTLVVKKTLKPINEKSLNELIKIANSRPPKVKERFLKQIVRVKPFADFVKQKNNFVCEICHREPFIQKNGLPYAEADHITPLGGENYGKDSPENMRCLCAQCHAIITHGSDAEIKKLLSSSESRSSKYVH